MDESASFLKGPSAHARVVPISEILSWNLSIPGYQRPYRWTTKEVGELLEDLERAFQQNVGEYRLGTIILHERLETSEHGIGQTVVDIVDGQQRVLTLVLLMRALGHKDAIPLADAAKGVSFTNPMSMTHIRENFAFLKQWATTAPSGWSDSQHPFLSKVLTAVVITVDDVNDAFQLFDSQNSRGRALDPHDLLKAHHLRAMHEDDDRMREDHADMCEGHAHMREDHADMREVVTAWEEHSPKDLLRIFGSRLFPIIQWTNRKNAEKLTTHNFDVFKGIGLEEGYTYARAAKEASPLFQIGQPFIEGADFFAMTQRYLDIEAHIETALKTDAFEPLSRVLDRQHPSRGLLYTRDLFINALIAYYDRFGQLDPRAVFTLFRWAFQLRLDMLRIGADTINKYALGSTEANRYSNHIAMFERIRLARKHTEIGAMTITHASPKEAPRGTTAQEQSDIETCFQEILKQGSEVQR